MFTLHDEQGHIRNLMIQSDLFFFETDIMASWKTFTFSPQLGTLMIDASGLYRGDSVCFRRLVQVFQFFAQHQLIWKRMEFHRLVRHPQVSSVLEAANALICQELKLDVDLVLQSTHAIDDACFLAGLSQNVQLQVLELNWNSRCYTAGDVRELCRLLETTTNLQEFSTGPMHWNDFQVFLQALSRNVSLTTIRLWPCDTQVSSLLETIGGHPNITYLNLHCDNFKHDNVQTLTRLLCQKQLKSLDLDACLSCSRPTACLLLDALRKQTKMQRLRLVRLDSLGFGEIMRTVLEMEALQYFQLDQHFVTMKEPNADLQAISGTKRRQTPLQLRSDEATFRYHQSILEPMLQAHPGIRLENPRNVSLQDPVAHLVNLNWHGRYLLERTDIPLSVWHRVLQGASAKRSILYELLKGPAFCGRTSLVPSSTNGNEKTMTRKRKFLAERVIE